MSGFLSSFGLRFVKVGGIFKIKEFLYIATKDNSINTDVKALIIFQVQQIKQFK